MVLSGVIPQVSEGLCLQELRDAVPCFRKFNPANGILGSYKQWIVQRNGDNIAVYEAYRIGFMHLPNVDKHFCPCL